MSGDELVLGVDFGTESCRAALFDLEGHCVATHATEYGLSHPHPGWAEQDPDEWWSALQESVRGVLETADVSAERIAGMSVDATTCTVVALDDGGRHLRPAIMWMDVRASDQAARISELDHPARRVCGNGENPVSAEWLPSKLLWLAENEPEVCADASWIVDAPDWATYRLTGRVTANVNTAAMRGFHDRDQGGWPIDFYEQAGIANAGELLAADVLDLGEPVGELSEKAAEDLGLRAGTPVAQGGGDAWAGQIGLGVVSPGRMALITGSSHVLIGQSDEPLHGPGFFGTFTDAVIPGQYSIEGGQVSTGSVLKWFKDNFARDATEDEARTRGVSAYEVLNERIADIPPGSDGLIVCEYWQGNRTPYTDPLARGIMWGLSLHHTPEHVYRAIQEGIGYGTAHNLRAMRDSGFEVTEMVAAGGFTNSRQLMQMQSDIAGVPIVFTEVGDAVALGSAILAAVGAGLFESVADGVGAMVHQTDTIEPDPDVHERYAFFVDAYAETYPAVRPLVHRMSQHIADTS